jgi:hypothetical protein
MNVNLVIRLRHVHIFTVVKQCRSYTCNSPFTFVPITGTTLPLLTVEQYYKAHQVVADLVTLRLQRHPVEDPKYLF